MIFYFSGTGNTRWAAETIAKETGERLLFIPEELKGDCHYTLSDDERIGFCFPTHGWQPPRIVRRFINRLHIDHANGHYCFALTTCGDSIGLTMDLLNQDLRKANLPKAVSTFTLIMPESYVCLPFMYTDKPEREREKIATAQKQTESIVQTIKSRQSGVEKLVKGFWPWGMTHVVGTYFNGHMVTDQKFTVDHDKCVKCGACAKACPTGNVQLVGGLPQWKHDESCTCCLACYHHCPKHAINYGSITRKRGQYYFKPQVHSNQK